MTRRQRRDRGRRRRPQPRRPSTRLAVGAGLSLGAALGSGATAQAADFTVTAGGDAAGGTLRQAILDANANNNGPTVDRILFTSSITGTIHLQSELPTIDEPVDIVGPGADKLTVAGNDSFQLMEVNSSGPVSLTGLRLIDGHSVGYGGAIYIQAGATTIERSTLASNTSGDEGGAILTSGFPLTIRNSTVANNDGTYGGGISVHNAEIAIENSTISGNQADRGGGIFTASAASKLTVLNSTISGNTAESDGGGIETNNSTVDPLVEGTIVANNTAAVGPDLRGNNDSFGAGFSLIEDPSGAGLNQSGPNVLGQDPQLGPLAANGGPTPTMALGPTSPALDRNSSTRDDQRGSDRPVDFPGLANSVPGNGADIGAFELAGRSCQGQVESRPASLLGTAGVDVIVGTAGADAIKALGGNDLVCAGAGRDRVGGGAGNDVLRGEAGADVLRGQAGRDRLIGGPGRDRLLGGPQRDKLRGGPGKDRQRQ